MSRLGIVRRLLLSALAFAWAASSRPAAAQGLEPCNVSAVCLGGQRYQFIVFWDDASMNQHVAQPVTLTADSGYFWFFEPSNIEVMVKTLDGCSENGRVWIFLSGMTNLPIRVQVMDGLTGVAKTYTNPAGTLFAPVMDLTTFSDCPGPSEGPVSGSWSGTFTSADFVDCDGPGPATATFVQSGSVVTGTLDAPNLFCGPDNVRFAGLLDGDTLTGTVTGRDGGRQSYSGATAFGNLTKGGSQLDLLIINADGLIPGGTLQLHR